MIKKAVVLAVTLALGACASAQPQLKTRYVLDSKGDLATEQYYVQAQSDNDKYWKTALVVGASVLGIAGMVYLIDTWTSDDTTTTTAAPPSNGLVPTGGSSSSSWSTDYLVPTYVPVGGAEIQPIEE